MSEPQSGDKQHTCIHKGNTKSELKFLCSSTPSTENEGLSDIGSLQGDNKIEQPNEEVNSAAPANNASKCPVKVKELPVDGSVDLHVEKNQMVKQSLNRIS